MNLKNDIVFNTEFAKAFNKLMKLAFSATISLQLIATLKTLNEQQKNVFAVRDSLLDRLAKKDDAGKFKFVENMADFIDEASASEFFKEMDELLKLEFEIPLKEKLKLDEKIQISAEDILVLKPVLDITI